MTDGVAYIRYQRPDGTFTRQRPLDRVRWERPHTLSCPTWDEQPGTCTCRDAEDERLRAAEGAS